MAGNFADFLAAPVRETVLLAVCSCAKRTNGADVTLRFAKAGGSGRVPSTGTAGSANRYWTRLVNNGYLFRSARVPVGTLSVLQDLRGGELRLAQFGGDLDTGEALLVQNAGVGSIRGLTFGGRDVELFMGGGYEEKWMDLGAYESILKTKMGEAKVSGSDVIIPLRELESRLDDPLEDRTFFGTRFCLYFDGTGDYVLVDDSPSGVYDYGSGPQTWRFRIWIDALPAGTQTILSRGAQDTDGYALTISTDGKLSWRTWQSGAGQATETDTALTLGAWNTVYLTFNGSTTANWYLEGELHKTGTGHTAPTGNTSRDLYFGRADSGANSLVGHLQEIATWDEELTADEISEQWTRPLNSEETAEARLLGLWRCNDGSGTTLDEETTNNKNGDITNAVFRPSLCGDEENEGEVLPNVFGFEEHFEPVLIDAERQIYQVHRGPIEDLMAAFQGGATLAQDHSDYTSLAAFGAVTTAPVKYDVLIANGGTWIRFGSEHTNPLGLKLKGDKHGGTYRYKGGDLIRHILTTRGTQPLDDTTEINSTALDALNTANPAVLRYSTTKAVTIREVVDYLLVSLGAYGWLGRSDQKFKAQRFEGAAGGTALGTITEKDVVKGTLRPVDVDPPTGAVFVEYRHNPRKMEHSDLTPGVLKMRNWSLFLRRSWFRQPSRSPRTFRNFKDAQSITVQTAFTTQGDARKEARRRRLLFDGQAFAFEMQLRDVFREVDIFDIFYFDYHDLDLATGARQQRLGTGPTVKFIVLAIEESGNNSIKVTLWREG